MKIGPDSTVSGPSAKALERYRTFPLRQVQIEVVNVCNFRCPLCRTIEKGGVPRGRMELDTFKRVLEPVIADVEFVVFYGTKGEPLLNSDLAGQIAWIKSRNPDCFTTLSTNGSLWSDAKCRAIVEAGLDEVVFAVDGLSEESYSVYRVGGTLSEVVKGLSRLRDVRDEVSSELRIVFQFIPMSHNEHEVANVRDFALGVGADSARLKLSSSVAASAVFAPSGAHQPGVTEADVGFTCPFGVQKMYVDPNADCYMCCYAEGREGMAIGNALEEDIRAIWTSDALWSVRAGFAGMADLHPFCSATCGKKARKQRKGL